MTFPLDNRLRTPPHGDPVVKRWFFWWDFPGSYKVKRRGNYNGLRTYEVEGPGIESGFLAVISKGTVAASAPSEEDWLKLMEYPSHPRPQQPVMVTRAMKRRIEEGRG